MVEGRWLRRPRHGGAPYGGEHGCGLFFCWDEHLEYAPVVDELTQLCPACRKDRKPYAPTPDTAEWENWKLTDPSWQQWRDENPELVQAMTERGKGSATEQENQNG